MLNVLTTRLGLLLLLFAWCPSVHGADAERTGADATRAPGRTSSGQRPVSTVPHVATIRLRSETNATMARSLTGTLAARRSSNLGFKRVGRIDSILVDEGAVVHSGQVLATIDTATLKAELAVMAAQRTAAQARLEELISGPRAQSIEAARAQLTELTAMRDQAQITFQRRQSLARSEAIAQQDIDDARHMLAAADARVQAQQQVLAELEEGTRGEQIAAQRAECLRLDASLASIQLLIDESTLLAPYSAIISRRLADEGTITAPGEPILRVVEKAPLEARIGIPVELIADVRSAPRQRLLIQGQERFGTLRAILPELEPTTRTQTALIDLLPDEDANGAQSDVTPAGSSPQSSVAAAQLPLADAIGQIVQLQVQQPVPQAGYWLPLAALSRGVKGLWSVFVVESIAATSNETPHHVVRRHDVEIVQIDSERVLVTGTLQAGSQIVVGGVQKLVPGQRVIPQEPPQDAPAGTDAG